MSAKPIQTVKGWPVLGSIMHYKRDALSLFLNAARDLGDVSAIMMGPTRVVLVNSPQHVAEILQDRTDAFGRSPSYRELELLLGAGMLTTEGAQWKAQRAQAQPAFQKKQLTSMIPTIREKIDQVVGEWMPAGQTGLRRRDLFADMLDMSMRITLRTLFGQVHELAHRKMITALEDGSRYVIQRLEGIVNLPPHWPTPSAKEFWKNRAVLDASVLDIIRQYQRGTQPPNLLGMVLEGDGPQDEENIKNQLLTLFITSYETVATGMTWVFHFLSQHPRWYQAVVEELERYDELGYDDIFSLTTTNAVIHESLRLMPPIWSFSRTAKRDVTIDGYPIAAGTMVVVSPYCLQRHPSHWDDPDTFNPARWTAGSSTSKRVSAFLPFGTGPRICVGMNYAMMLLPLILKGACRRGTFSLDSAHPVRIKAGVTIRPVGGLMGHWTSHERLLEQKGIAT
ncbi:cytochrome P450 [Paraburkholderia megapolitana]|uniref:Cytochrome P450 n=1 Tax=Paraburkholderia megapolitana TaxID=420953 RepID=A0A1I3VUN1_9BURK|nr:cytochrome P450 [Paraburkholderia megapolitana]SFJ97831.1 Cytochrome P450 [Paraburkholderia megapolitana]